MTQLDLLERMPELQAKAKRNHQPIPEKFSTYDGEEGNESHLTADLWTNLPMSYARRLPGERGERRRFGRDISLGVETFGNYTLDEWWEFLNWIADGGMSDKRYAIFIIVKFVNEPIIREGNHRVQAFQQLKLQRIPANVRFWGKGEDYVNPDSVLYDEIQRVK